MIYLLTRSYSDSRDYKAFSSEDDAYEAQVDWMKSSLWQWEDTNLSDLSDEEMRNSWHAYTGEFFEIIALELDPDMTYL